MKLNLGCGFKKKPGFINVDIGNYCEPDVVVDLANQNWPWENDSVEEAEFEFSLEQMGHSPEHLIHVVSELFRVCKNEASVKIISLHPRHDQFLLNPMCSQRISVEFFHMLNIQNNLQQISHGLSYNCLGLQYGINFIVAEFKYLLTNEMHQKRDQLSEQQIREKIQHENNICQAIEIHLRVGKLNNEVKP